MFRGKGVKLDEVIQSGEDHPWDKRVTVKFQHKAYYDADECVDWARRKVPDMTRDARRNDEESVLFSDNLRGQTTELFKRTCGKYKCKNHFYPTGCTDILQLVDQQLGQLIKRKMGEGFDDWIFVRDNFDHWQMPSTRGG